MIFRNKYFVFFVVMMVVDVSYIEGVYSREYFLPVDVEEYDPQDTLYRAQQGERSQQFIYAYMLLSGIKEIVDYDLAYSWMKCAAEKDYPLALTMLSQFYRLGLGVGVDLQKSIHYLHSAEEYDEPESLFLLGLYYHKGIGVDKDADKAASFYERAEKYEHPGAIYNHGLLLIRLGDKNDVKMGVRLLEKSGSLGNYRAYDYLSWLYASGSYVDLDKVLAEKYRKQSELVKKIMAYSAKIQD